MKLQEKSMLFVALDSNKQKKIFDMAEKLADVEGNFGFKVNLNFLAKPWRRSLRFLKQFGKPVFADMKMANGKRTMIWQLENLTKEEVDFTNIWAYMEEQLEKTIAEFKGKEIKVLGMTVPTHFDEKYCQRILRRSLPEAVRLFTEISKETGCYGAILPGTTLDAVKDIPIRKIVPGIRPEWYPEDKRHKEKITPEKAILAGAWGLVIGGPITKSNNPVETLERILEEIDQAETQLRIAKNGSRSLTNELYSSKKYNR